MRIVSATTRRGAGVVASVLRLVGMLIVLVLVVYVLLTALDANFGNVWAAAVREAADYFDLGLANLFQPPDPKVAVAMSFGTAALIWWAITAVVVRLVRRIG
jgi:CelD/BcsL family acetyltransferase involved in cellulose biosynthesis